MFLLSEDIPKFRAMASDIFNSEAFNEAIVASVAECLKTIPLFSMFKKKAVGPLQIWNDKKLRELAAMFFFREFKGGDVIFNQGDIGDCFYILHAGHLKIVSPNAEGEDVVLAEMKQSDWLGEMAFIADCRRTATVVAQTNCTLLRLDQKDFQSFIQLAPSLADDIARKVNVRTAENLERIEFFGAVKEAGHDIERGSKPYSRMGLLGAIFKWQTGVAGQVMVTQDQPSEHFYVIVEGKVKVEHINHRREVTYLGELGEQSWFGEIGLMFDIPRTANITCVGPCLFLQLSRTRFESFKAVAPALAAPFQGVAEQRTAGLLQALDLFGHLEQKGKRWDCFEIMASLSKYQTSTAGETIMKIGETGTKFYVIVSGEVRCVSAAGVETTVERGGYFGEISLLRKSHHTATVVTTRPCTFLTLTSDDFKTFLKFAPEARVNIAEVIEQRLATFE